MTNKTSIDATKKLLRQKLLEQRSSREPAVIEEGGRKIAEFGLDFLPLTGGEVVSGFYPKDQEFSCIELMRRLEQKGHHLCLPVVRAKAQPLIFRQWSYGGSLLPDSFGVSIPPAENGELSPDLMLVPLLVFDMAGYRLGYGGGFYDRTIEQLRNRKQIITVGIAFDHQEMVEVPHDEKDQRLDWVLTPTGPRQITARAG